MSKTPPIALLLALLLPRAAAAQVLPTEPLRLFDGRVRIGGDVTATVGAEDHEAYFNYTDYERNALRGVRAGLTAIWQPADRVAALAEVRLDGLSHFEAYAAFIRVRPWRSVPFDIQAGRIPPVFGSFGRRTYQADRMLIGYPLAYQYLTSMRADAQPASTDDLLRMRGRGWLASFPVGSPYPAPGVPLISAFRWDTGVQARWAAPSFEAAVSVTNGTLANPRVRDDNGGKQVAARVSGRPLTGLVLGGSASQGAWVSDDVAGAPSSGSQAALGADLEYSRDHWVVRSEMVWSRWRLPFLTPPVDGTPVTALGAWVEGRYKLTPRIYLAGRADRLAFSRVTGALFGGAPTPWEAPVTRFEVGGGYLLQRNLVLRGVVQINHREGGRVEDRTFLSGQVAWWF